MWVIVVFPISNTETNSDLSVKRSPVVCHSISIVCGSVLSAEMKCVWGGGRENSETIWEAELVPMLSLIHQLALSWHDKETIRFSVYHSKNRATLPSIGVMRCLISFIGVNTGG